MPTTKTAMHHIYFSTWTTGHSTPQQAMLHYIKSCICAVTRQIR